MADEHNYGKGHIAPRPKKKEHIRIFVQRKRLLPGILHKFIPSKSNSLERLSSVVRKNLNTNKKNVIVVNYKPVYVDSPRRKTKPTLASPVPDDRPRSLTVTPTFDNPSYHSNNNRQSVSFDVPDVEDPFMFIEMMYQQLFTEDGQLRSETESKVLADCVKQIVTHSRRNSMAHRDSISTNIHLQKLSMQSKSTSLSSSPRFIPEEEPNRLFQRNKATNASRRSSKRSSVNNADHQQQLHAFLSSYYHQQKRASASYPISVDDTDNEDFDTFSDMNSYRKTIRTSPPASIDEDATEVESKLLSSSGYQSLKSQEPVISKVHSENAHHHCPHCMNAPQIIITPPSTSSLNIIQPVREAVTKYLNFIFISKNILLIPLFIFLLRQRSMHIGK